MEGAHKSYSAKSRDAIGVTFGLLFCRLFSFLPPLLIFVQSFHGLCVLTFIFGFCFEAWFAIIWVLIYNLLPVKIALDASGMLGFWWGIALLVVPIFQTLILNSSTPMMPGTPLSTNNTNTTTVTNNVNNVTNVVTTTATAFTSTEFNFTTSGEPVDLAAGNETMIDPFDLTGESRSCGNRMVMMCVFLAAASLTQFVMYFMVIRPKYLAQKVNENDKTVTDAH